MVDNVRILSQLFDYAGHKIGPCMTAFENKLGGRVVVSGYYPWRIMHNAAKVGQMKSVVKWLSHDTLTVVIETFAKVITWVRTNADGDKVVILLNGSLDPVSTLKIKVRSNASGFRLLTLGEKEEKEVQTEQTGEADYVRVILKDVDAWSMHVLRPIT